ncbi:TPR-like protein [Pyrenochaeta sp. DS3sAY3a]|nr:TPR-like protein [Pyrenochaeta sp. DS3sAY3a]
MEDDLKLKQYLIDSSSDDNHLDGALEKLRSGKPPLSYTGAFEELQLNGFIRLIDFTEQPRQSTTDDIFNEACKREAYASERELGSANIVTIMLKQILASAYKCKSQFEAAASLEKENLDSMMNEPASDNPLLPKLLSRLGSTCCELERYEEALELQQRAVKLVSESFEGRHPTALNTSAALASAFWKCGKWDDAERLFSELMQKNEVLLGIRHPESIALRANLSVAKKKLGKLEDAEKLGREAFALSEDTLGPHSPVTWNIATNLSRILMGQGEYEKIGNLLELLRKRQEERKSEDHLEKLRALNVLADSYRHRRMFEEAKQILASTAHMQSTLQGKSHADVIRTQLLLAQCLHDEKSSSEAVSLLNDVLQRYIGENPTAGSKAVPWPFDTTTELASQLKKHGQLAEAGKLEESVIRSRREVVGAAHPSIIEDEYEASIDEEPLKKLVGDHVVAVKTLADVGSTYIDKDKLDRARRVLIKALKAASQVFGADDMVTFSILCNLASAYALKGMADQAFFAYLKAIRAKVRTLGDLETILSAPPTSKPSVTGTPKLEKYLIGTSFGFSNGRLELGYSNHGEVKVSQLAHPTTRRQSACTPSSIIYLKPND